MRGSYYLPLPVFNVSAFFGKHPLQKSLPLLKHLEEKLSRARSSTPLLNICLNMKRPIFPSLTSSNPPYYLLPSPLLLFSILKKAAAAADSVKTAPDGEV